MTKLAGLALAASMLASTVKRLKIRQRSTLKRTTANLSPFASITPAGKVWTNFTNCGTGTKRSPSTDHPMIIRMLSSKWGTGSDLSFQSAISCER